MSFELALPGPGVLPYEENHHNTTPVNSISGQILISIAEMDSLGSITYVYTPHLYAIFS